MAATPQYAQFMFRGRTTGQLYTIDAYVSDVNGAVVRFDNGAGASSTSAEFITFGEPVLLVDYSMVTGTADTEKLRLTANSAPLPHILRYGVHLTSLNNRPVLNIPFRAGTRISAFQISD
jgi:hypothetical protein